jgi:hypothetical protein
MLYHPHTLTATDNMILRQAKDVLTKVFEIISMSRETGKQQSNVISV